MLEREIERRLKTQVEELGCLFEKFTSPGKRGVSDRIVTIPGRPAHIIFLEIKTEGGAESKLQTRQRKKRLAMGADARLITGWQEAQQFAEEVRAECYTTRISTSNTARI